jgi:hypothetical protein
VQKIFEWFEGEVKSLPEVFAGSNGNFITIMLEDVVNMLHSTGCDNFPDLHSLAASCGASILKSVSVEVQN